jgi:hypothetical protein
VAAGASVASGASVATGASVSTGAAGVSTPSQATRSRDVRTIRIAKENNRDFFFISLSFISLNMDSIR